MLILSLFAICTLSAIDTSEGESAAEPKRKTFKQILGLESWSEIKDHWWFWVFVGVLLSMLLLNTVLCCILEKDNFETQFENEACPYQGF